MGSAVEKQFLHLKGIPILAHTLRVFEQSPEVGGIVLVVAPQQRQALEREHSPTPTIKRFSTRPS